MKRFSWLVHILLRSLLYRKGRTLLLLSVVAMAASLVTALGIVSDAMGERVSEELRKYGANLVVVTSSIGMDTGSAASGSTGLTEPVWLDQHSTAVVLNAHRSQVADFSLHLRGAIQINGIYLPTEGVDFSAMRRLHPWWQLEGAWPAAAGMLVGSDLATTLSLRPGSQVILAGPGGTAELIVSGIVSAGGDEDKLLFIPLEIQQRLLDLPGRLSRASIVAITGKEPLEQIAKSIQAGLPGAQVKEVRQVAHTSEELLRKVQLLLLLVTGVVVITSGASVAGTTSTTVLERGREIGLMKAIGGSRRAVVLIFVLEAFTIGACGGVVGYLCGVAIAAVIMKTVFAAGFVFAPFYLPVAICVGLALVLVGSLGPLMAVFRVDPVQSLRGE